MDSFLRIMQPMMNAVLHSLQLLYQSEVSLTFAKKVSCLLLWDYLFLPMRNFPGTRGLSKTFDDRVCPVVRNTVFRRPTTSSTGSVPTLLAKMFTSQLPWKWFVLGYLALHQLPNTVDGRVKSTSASCSSSCSINSLSQQLFELSIKHRLGYPSWYSPRVSIQSYSSHQRYDMDGFSNNPSLRVSTVFNLWRNSSFQSLSRNCFRHM